MTMNSYQEPRYHWNKAAETIKQAGENLRDRLGDRPFSKTEINGEVLKLSDYAPNSIYPSDYCYNMLNKYPGSFEFPLFEQIQHGFYRYLGPSYKYSGIICWKGKPVGYWKEGRYRLERDPRKKQNRD